MRHGVTSAGFAETWGLLVSAGWPPDFVLHEMPLDIFQQQASVAMKLAAERAQLQATSIMALVGEAIAGKKGGQDENPISSIISSLRDEIAFEEEGELQSATTEDGTPQPAVRNRPSGRKLLREMTLEERRAHTAGLLRKLHGPFAKAMLHEGQMLPSVEQIINGTAGQSRGISRIPESN